MEGDKPPKGGGFLAANRLVSAVDSTEFASHVQFLRKSAKRLVGPPGGVSSSNSQLTDELRSILMRMSDTERTRLFKPLNETIVDIEKSVIANRSLSDERKVAYSGYKLSEFIKKNVSDDDER